MGDSLLQSNMKLATAMSVIAAWPQQTKPHP
jgi:hypothetical protein